ncbi:hypothetical protein RI367_003904 [Sorochytrium milnesiophthora]
MPQTHTIHVVRHGARADWLPSPLPSLTGLVHDPPLSPLGELQANELANLVSSTWPPHQRPRSIFCSPFYRCIQTITPTLIARRGSDLRLTLDDGIAEWYSTLTIKTHPPLLLEQLAPAGSVPDASHVPTRKLPASRDLLRSLFAEQSPLIDWDARPIFAADPRLATVEESQDALLERVQLFLRDMVAQGHTRDGPVMLVTHAATAIAIGRALTNDRTREVRCGVASVSTYTYTTPSASELPRLDDNGQWSPAWSCTQNGYTDHLTSGEVHNWSFDMR